MRFEEPCELCCPADGIATTSTSRLPTGSAPPGLRSMWPIRRSALKTLDPSITVIYPPRSRAPISSQALEYLRTTDHNRIGKLYLITSFGFFMVAGLMAMLMRAELARPGL